MKLVIVNYEDYDMYTIRVSHPIEYKDKETLLKDFDFARETAFQKEKNNRASLGYPGDDFFYYAFNFQGVFMMYSKDYQPELYTVDEWFDKYKDCGIHKWN